MNLGYVPLENSKDKSIEDLADQYLNFQDPIRPHCLLYEKTLSLCSKYPLFSEQTKLLEVGCGLGGGLQWLKIAHEQLSETVGMDPIVSSRSKHDNMVKGAQKRYRLQPKHLILFSISKRVLKFGGYLCWADLRHKDKMEDVLMDAKECGIHQTSARYEKMLENAPWFIRIFKNTFKHVYCSPGTDTYNQYVDGERTYAVACWQKNSE
uniref:Class I SAM-dependent methyltransferase n=1 Tax=Ditylenchus dipsaci TaxID=166011 RepID=A0A915DE05_9BILA